MYNVVVYLNVVYINIRRCRESSSHMHILFAHHTDHVILRTASLPRSICQDAIPRCRDHLIP